MTAAGPPNAGPDSRRAALAGAALGFFGVAAGAFGAHALRTRLAPDTLAVFETGVRFELVHALALLGTAWAAAQWPGRAARAAIALFFAGTVLFSGSLYALALSGERLLGIITPVGGLLLLGGWVCLAWAAAGGRHPDERVP